MKTSHGFILEGVPAFANRTVMSTWCHAAF